MNKWYSFKGNRVGLSDYFTESGCLSELGFAQYVSGSLTDKECHAVEKHLVQCDECLEVVGDVIQVLHTEPTEEEKALCATTPADIERCMELLKPYLRKRTLKERIVSQFSNILHGLASPRFAYSMVIVLGMALAGMLVWMRSTHRQYEQLYAQGLESLRSVPNFEPASGLRFIAALVEPREERRSESAPQDGLNALDSALVYFGQALGSNPNYVRARVGLGQVYLVKRQPREAQKHFQEALNLDKSSQEAVNGLGVALFELAMAERDLYKRDDLLRASSEKFAKILAADPGRLEALYNQALALYKLGDKSKTLDIIERYLAQDSKSKWAERLSSIRDKLRLSSYKIFSKEIEEAFKSAQLDRLAQMVSSSPHAAWLIKKFLRVGVKLEVEGDFDGARQAFGIAEAVEKEYRQFTGDENYRQLLCFYSKLTDGQKQKKYQAIRMEEDAFTHYRRGNHEESLKLSAKALTICQKLDDYWDLAFIHHLTGNCYFFCRSDYDRALKAYEAMVVAAERGRDHDELARALGSISVIYQDRGNYYDMRAHLDKMLISAEKVRNTIHQAFALNYLGNLYRELGNWEEGIRYYSQALTLNRRIGDQNSQLENLEHISFLYQRNKEYNKSIGFL